MLPISTGAAASCAYCRRLALRGLASSAASAAALQGSSSKDVIKDSNSDGHAVSASASQSVPPEDPSSSSSPPPSSSSSSSSSPPSSNEHDRPRSSFLSFLREGTAEGGRGGSANPPNPGPQSKAKASLSSVLRALRSDDSTSNGMDSSSTTHPASQRDNSSPNVTSPASRFTDGHDRPSPWADQKLSLTAKSSSSSSSSTPKGRGKGKAKAKDDVPGGVRPDDAGANTPALDTVEVERVNYKSPLRDVKAYFQVCLAPLYAEAAGDKTVIRKLNTFLNHWLTMFERTDKPMIRGKIIRRMERKQGLVVAKRRLQRLAEKRREATENGGRNLKDVPDDLWTNSAVQPSTTELDPDLGTGGTQRPQNAVTKAQAATTAAAPVPKPPRSKTPQSVSLQEQEDQGENVINAKKVEIRPLKPLHDAEVATLAHGLQGVVSKPGRIRFLQDPVRLTYSYDKSLQTIPPVDSFDFESLPRFVRPSEDDNLRELLKQSKRVFAGSTSSLTGALSQIYFTLNGGKELQCKLPNFEKESRKFTGGAQIPASIKLNLTEDGTYLIDADKSVEGGKTETIASKMGHVLEKMLTYEPTEFERFQKDTKNPFKPEESRDKREAYHYSSTPNMIMRSQLDCRDMTNPKKVFDIKTRATMAIRHDMPNHRHNAGYTLWRKNGRTESFEKEKYDLIRSAFLKYSMQVRIGAMHGIFLAYHSTQRIFGFEYISLEDMDNYISGNHEESTQAFNIGVALLEKILLRAIEDQPAKSLRLTFDSVRPGTLQVFSSPDGDDSASPLLLYTISVTNYLDGESLASSQPVDFNTFHSAGSNLPTEDETGERVPTSSFKRRTTPSKRARKLVNKARRDLVWSITYDIAPSHDEAYNQKALQVVRKEQNRFSKTVVLPDGLTEEQIAEALKGVPVVSKLVAGASEDGALITADPETEPNSVPATKRTILDFHPEPGVKYVRKVPSFTRRLRQMATWGWERQARDAKREAALARREARRKELREWDRAKRLGLTNVKKPMSRGQYNREAHLRAEAEKRKEQSEHQSQKSRKGEAE